MALADVNTWLLIPQRSRDWMKGYGALYAIRRPADQSVLYIGQTQNMWRRLYTKRNDHEGIAYFFGEGIDYEIAYWHKPITEQDRLIAEIELTAQWRPWWIYDFPLEQRREWTNRFRSQLTGRVMPRTKQTFAVQAQLLGEPA